MPAPTVSHALYPVEQHLKTALLTELLRRTDTKSVLVFTRTKHRAEQVAQQLNKAGCRAASLQGNLSQNQRQYALDAFRDGSCKVLVATDIASRGIDVLSISHIINYDMPDDTDAYIHRIGRTGRIGKTGDAFTFVTNKDTDMVRALDHLFPSPLQRCTLQDFNYKAGAPGGERTFSPHRIRRPVAPFKPKQEPVKHLVPRLVG